MDISSGRGRRQPRKEGAHAFPEKLKKHDGNFLLDSLPSEDRAALFAMAQPFTFQPGQTFCEPDSLPVSIDFVLDGVISAVVELADGRSVESYMVGREGAFNALGLESAHRCGVRLVGQTPGAGLRVPLSRLKPFAEEHPAIRQVLADYASRLMDELGQSTACNALHQAEERFAKWLLRCHDRVKGDTLNLTQQFLADMLGSQRTTVNEAAQHLQRLGAIHYMRGRIDVRDRVALESAACECYRGCWASLEASVARARAAS